MDERSLAESGASTWESFKGLVADIRNDRQRRFAAQYPGLVDAGFQFRGIDDDEDETEAEPDVSEQA